MANRTDAQTEELLVALRRLRFSGPELSELLGIPLSTVSAVLKRAGVGKLGRLGLEPAQRYERQRPGELVHIDIKKLGRIQGGPGKRITGISRNRRPTRTDRDGHRRLQAGWEAVHVAVDDATRLAYAEVLADEKATTSVAFLARATRFFARHGITVESVITDNGFPCVSTERFIRTLQNGWLHHYNHHRPHQAIGRQPPIRRLNNLLGTYS